MADDTLDPLGEIFLVAEGCQPAGSCYLLASREQRGPSDARSRAFWLLDADVRVLRSFVPGAVSDCEYLRCFTYRLEGGVLRYRCESDNGMSDAPARVNEREELRITGPVSSSLLPSIREALASARVSETPT